MGKSGLFMSMDMSCFLKKFNIRKIYKIINIALIFMLIRVFLCVNIGYSADNFSLRVYIDGTYKRKKETIGEIKRKKPVAENKYNNEIANRILLVKRKAKETFSKFISSCSNINADNSSLVRQESLVALLESCIGIGLIGENKGKGFWHTLYRKDADETYFPVYDSQTETIKDLFTEKELTAVIVPSVFEKSLATLNNIEKYLKTRSPDIKVFIFNPFKYFSKRYDYLIGTVIKIEKTGKISLFFEWHKGYIGIVIFSDNEWRWVEIDKRAIEAGLFRKDFIRTIENNLLPTDVRCLPNPVEIFLF